MSDDQHRYGALLRTERHPNTDLLCAVRDGIGDDAVNPYCRQGQGDDREDTEQQGVQTRLSHLTGERLRQWLGYRFVQLRVDRPDGLLCCYLYCQRIRMCRPHEQ